MTFNASKSTTYVIDGKLFFTDLYRGKDNIEGVLTSYLNRIQALESAIWEVIEERLIDNAEGVQLDANGRIVGLGRISSSDSIYRQGIKAQIRINISQGSVEDLNALGQIYFPTTDGWSVYENLPMGIVFELEDDIDPLGINIPVLARQLYRVRAAGREFRFKYNTFDADEAFTLTFNGDSTDGDTLGLGSVSTVTGGKLVALHDPTPETEIKLASEPEPFGFDRGFDEGFF